VRKKKKKKKIFIATGGSKAAGGTPGQGLFIRREPRDGVTLLWRTEVVKKREEREKGRQEIKGSA